MNKVLKMLTVFNAVMIVVILITLVVMGCAKHTADTTETTDTETTTEAEPFDFSISEEWKARIKTWEGFTASPINDCGYWAIGYGHQVCPVTEPKPDSVTREEAERLFEQDIHRYDDKIVEWCKENGVTLTRPVYEALVSFLYQFGWRTKYMTATNWWGNKLANYLNGNCSFEDFLKEAEQYCKANGIPNDAIRQRRVEEAEHIRFK